MKILFVTCRLPYPPLKGDQLRAFHQLRLLSRGHDVDLVCLAIDPPQVDQIAELKRFVRRLEVVPLHRWSIVRNAVLSVPSRLPVQVGIFQSRDLNDTITRLMRENKYDIAHVQLARMYDTLSRIRGLPLICDFVDALSENMKRRANSDRPPLNWMARIESRRMSELETDIVKRCAATVIVSERDAEAIRAEPRPVVIPNGVDLEKFPYRPSVGRTGVVFSGNLGYFPNSDAAMHLIRDVMPLVWRKEPGLAVVLAGANPPRSLWRVASGRPVQITGFVPDMGSVIAAAAVTAIPLRAGSGLQNKVLEAMASGVPIICYPRAVEGIPNFVPDIHGIVVRTPQEMAEKILSVLRVREEAERLARAGRDLVERLYGWEASVGMLENLYVRVCERLR